MTLNNSLDLYTLNDLRNFPKPEWLLTDHLHKGDVAVIWGQPSSGKSFLALDWALSIATGQAWLGKYAVHQSPTLYMAGEGAPSIYKRVNAWILAHKHQGELETYFHLRPLPLLEAEVIQQIQDTLSDFGDIVASTSFGDVADEDITYEPEGLRLGLLVVDTLSQFFGDGDEVSKDMTQFVNHMRQLARDSNTAVLIVHHGNAGGARERGHTSLRGNIEAAFEVKAIRQDNKLVGLTLTNDKQKDDPENLPMKLSLVVCENSLVVSGVEPIVEAKKASTPGLMRKADMLAVLAAAEEGYTFTEWRLATGIPRSAFARRLRQLLNDGEIVKDPGNNKYSIPLANLDIAELGRGEDE